MLDKTPQHLSVGSRALMKAGAPVRQWMYTLEDPSRALLTPVRYAAAAADSASQPNPAQPYLEVVIARIMPPYAIVYHHDGQGWVRLWLDLRIVKLRPLSE
jgi:hypothetical protein